MGRKKAKQKKPLTIDFEFEPTMDRLLRQACEGGDAFLAREGGWPKEPNKTWIRKYLRHVHRGFAEAQDEVYSHLKELEVKTSASGSGLVGEEIYLRSVMDVVAWQMIQMELYIARRLYFGQKPPSLAQSNAESVMAVARDIANPDFDAFGLATDLTTFVQLGDVLAVGRSARLEVIEVKEGLHNEKILEFANALDEMGNAAAVDEFRKTEGEKSFKQLERIQRQTQRMRAATSLLNKEEGVDPSLGEQVYIREPSSTIRLYDDRLAHIIQTSDEHGWAIDVIDDCLFLGAYRGTMRSHAEGIFGAWFVGLSGGVHSPSFDLLASLTQPLALPPFGRLISRELALDLLFGRCRVLLGIHLPGLVELIRKSGGHVRQATRKEVARFRRRKSHPVMLEGKPLMIEFGDALTMVEDGILLRIMFHGLTPQTAVTVLLEPPTQPGSALASKRSSG